MFFYHIKREGFFGDKIFPLAKLKEKNKDLHEKYSEKYKDRISVTQQKVEKLNCNWDEVVFMTPHNCLKMSFRNL